MHTRGPRCLHPRCALERAACAKQGYIRPPTQSPFCCACPQKLDRHRLDERCAEQEQTIAALRAQVAASRVTAVR